MRNCRVCGVAIEAPAYHAPAPALTSIMTLIDTPTHVFTCDGCGHAQCDDIPEIQAFYDKVYRISLASEGHDQIFAVKADGAVIYRTDHQAEIALRLLDLPQGARVLDYGAAKADTLRKMHAARPDIQPHVFDVSKDYAAAWRGWVPQEAQAAYSVPSGWAGRFDAVMSHFVIEHVADPITFLRTLSALLRPGGVLLLSLPDVSANPGDMMVADHLNHFTEASLRRALAAANLAPKEIDTKSFPGAFFAVAGRVAGAPEEVPAAVVAQAIARTRGICDLWKLAEEKLEKQTTMFAGRKAAIYGAGFYGSWIYCRIVEKIDLVCFLDRNPHLQGTTRFDVPVLPPDEIADDVEVLIVGLNPLKAREAIAAQPVLQRPRLHHVWI